MSTPCFIINFNLLHSTKAMVEYLNTIPDIEVIVIDNHSDYEPTLEWYESNPCIIEKMPVQYGNAVLWTSPHAVEHFEKPEFFEKYDLYNRPYLVTDPDLDLSGVPKDFLDVMKEGIRRHPTVQRAEGLKQMLTIGLSLEITGLPDTDIARQAIGLEQMNWTGWLDELYCLAPVDTTMGYYVGKRKEDRDFNAALRINRPYTAKHIPWYFEKGNIPDDFQHYLRTTGKDWNYYTSRIRDTML